MTSTFNIRSLLQFAGAQPSLITGRSRAYFAGCGSFTKAQARTKCTNTDGYSWLATVPVSDFPAVRTAMAACSGGDTKCYWFDGRNAISAGDVKSGYGWAIGGTIEASGWAPDQPYGAGANELTWGACYFATDAVGGYGNDEPSTQFSALCMLYPCTASLDCNDRGTTMGSYGGSFTCVCRCQKFYGGRACRLLTQTLELTATLTRTVSMTGSKSISDSVRPSRSRSQAATLTPSHTISLLATNTLTTPQTQSASWSLSIPKSSTVNAPATLSITLTYSPSNTVSLTLSSTLSGTGRSPSSTSTTSGSMSPTLSRSLTSSSTISAASPSATYLTLRPTESLTHSCAYNETAVNSSCYQFQFIVDEATLAILARGELPPTGVASNDTAADSQPATPIPSPPTMDCSNVGAREVSIPYDVWKGRSGSVFTLAIKPSPTSTFTHFNPEMNFKERIAGGNMNGFTLLSSAFFIPTTMSISSSQPLTEDALLRWQAIHSHDYILLTFRYEGSASLNAQDPFIIEMDREKAFRCPLPGDLLFQLKPAASPRLGGIAGGVTEVLTVLNGLMMLPTAAIMLGTLTSIQSMSRCEAADLEDELDFINNPLGLSFGNVGEGRYQRGVLVGAIAIYAGFAALLVLMSVFQWALRRCVDRQEIRRRRRKNKKAAVPVLPLWKELCAVVAIGFPSALLPISAFILDGVTNAALTLMAISPSTPDRALGVFVLLFIILYILHVAWVTFKTPQSAEILPLQSPCPTASKRRKYGKTSTFARADDLDDFDDDDEMIPVNGALSTNRLLEEGSSDDFRLISSDSVDHLKTEPSSLNRVVLMPISGRRGHSSDGEGPLGNVSFSLTNSSNNGSFAQGTVDPTLSLSFTLLGLTPPAVDLRGPQKHVDNLEAKTDATDEVHCCSRVLNIVRYIFTAQCEWKGNAEWDTKYHHYIADCMPRLRTYRAIELTFGNFIGGLEALAFANQNYCTARLSMALLALCAFLLLVVIRRPIAVRSSLALVVVMLSIQAASAAIYIVNVKEQRAEYEFAADTLSLAATFIILLSSLCESAWFFFENSMIAKAALARLWALRNRPNGVETDSSESEEDASPMPRLETPPPTLAPTASPANEDLSIDDEAVREILTKFSAYCEANGIAPLKPRKQRRGVRRATVKTAATSGQQQQHQ